MADRFESDSSLLVDPGSGVRLPADDLTLLEPERNLLLGVLDAVGAVADVAALFGGQQLCSGQTEWSWVYLRHRWSSHHGWCRGRRQGGWWRQGELEKEAVSHCIHTGTGDGLPRPVLTASRPSQTMATMGPLFMSIGQVSIDRVPRGAGVVHSTRPAKKGLSLRSASAQESAWSAGPSQRICIVQWASRCSLPGVVSLMAASLYPRCSKREMMGPTSPRWTPSGLMAMKLCWRQSGSSWPRAPTRGRGRELGIKGWRGNRGAEGEGTGGAYVCSVDILASFLVAGGGEEGDC